MTSGELAKELMYYGVSAISLVTTGSHHPDRKYGWQKWKGAV